MAFGFPARYVEEIELEVDRDAARHAIVETLEALGWQYEKPHPDSYIAKTRINMLSYGEKVRIHFTENAALEIRSTCAMPSLSFSIGERTKLMSTVL